MCVCIYIYVCVCVCVWYSVRQWSRRLEFNPKLSHTKAIRNGTFLLNTQNYKVRIKGKVEPTREKE